MLLRDSQRCDLRYSACSPEAGSSTHTGWRYSVVRTEALERVLDRREFLVVLGGDCSILLGCMLATRSLASVAATAPRLTACPAQAGVSEKIVSRKPLGSVTSNARLFHSVP